MRQANESCKRLWIVSLTLPAALSSLVGCSVVGTPAGNSGSGTASRPVPAATWEGDSSANPVGGNGVVFDLDAEGGLLQARYDMEGFADFLTALAQGSVVNFHATVLDEAVPLGEFTEVMKVSAIGAEMGSISSRANILYSELNLHVDPAGVAILTFDVITGVLDTIEGVTIESTRQSVGSMSGNLSPDGQMITWLEVAGTRTERCEPTSEVDEEDEALVQDRCEDGNGTIDLADALDSEDLGTWVLVNPGDEPHFTLSIF